MLEKFASVGKLNMMRSKLMGNGSCEGRTGSVDHRNKTCREETMNLLPQILPQLLVRARKVCLGHASMERCSSPLKQRNPVGRWQEREKRAEADFSSFLKSWFPSHSFTGSHFSDLSFNCPAVYMECSWWHMAVLEWEISWWFGELLWANPCVERTE